MQWLRTYFERASNITITRSQCDLMQSAKLLPWHTFHEKTHSEIKLTLKYIVLNVGLEECEEFVDLTLYFKYQYECYFDQNIILKPFPRSFLFNAYFK